MTKTKTLLKGLLGATALTAFTAGTAFAGGTAADTTVSNTFTLEYSVGGTTQPPITPPAPTTFKVDRLVDLTVVSNGDTNVAPGAQDQLLIFTLTNDGNDTHGYSLQAINDSAGGDFDATGLTITYYVDDGDGVYEPGGDDGAPQTYNGTSTSDVAPDAKLFVVISGDIPAGATDSQTSDITLIADTLVSGGAGTPIGPDGDGINDINATENVLADDAGTANENANEGDHSATALYIVAAADISANKTVSVFSQDGAGCATIPGTPATPANEQYAVPGACVEYVITASNAGAATATAISIADTLATDLRFVSAQFSGFTGTPSFAPALPAANADCDATTCLVSMTAGELAGGTPATPTTGTLTIRALVK